MVAQTAEGRKRGRIGPRTLGARLHQVEEVAYKTCDTDEGGCRLCRGSWPGDAMPLGELRALGAAPCGCPPLRLPSPAAALTCDCFPRRCLPPTAGCGRTTPVSVQLQAAPRVFALQVAWPTNNETPEAIAKTLAALDESLVLREVRRQCGACGGVVGLAGSASCSVLEASGKAPLAPGLPPQVYPDSRVGAPTYRLRSMVCYYGQHYQARAARGQACCRVGQ